MAKQGVAGKKGNICDSRMVKSSRIKRAFTTTTAVLGKPVQDALFFYLESNGIMLVVGSKAYSLIKIKKVLDQWLGRSISQLLMKELVLALKRQH